MLNANTDGSINFPSLFQSLTTIERRNSIFKRINIKHNCEQLAFQREYLIHFRTQLRLQTHILMYCTIYIYIYVPQSSRNATELWQCDFSRSPHCCVSAKVLVLFCASLWIPLCNILVVVGVVWNYQFNSMVPVFSLGCSACSSHTHFEHYNEQLLACVLGQCLIMWIGKLIYTNTSTCKRMKDKWRNVLKKIWQKPDSR